MTLSLDTAYRSFSGEVEASSTPTICRLPDSRRHQLSAIALLPPVAALAVGLPAQRAIAQRFSGVLGMLSSLEVKSSTQPDGGEGLARISHGFKRIGAPNQRKLFCENDFLVIRGEPRCRQSVPRICLDLKPSKGAR